MTALPRRALRSRRSIPSWSMATSPHLSLKLREVLGLEAGDELLGLVDQAAGDISDLRGDLAELRHQTELGFARVDTRFAAVDVQLANLGRQMEKQTNRLILWSFAFWVTTLGAFLAVLLDQR